MEAPDKTMKALEIRSAEQSMTLFKRDLDQYASSMDQIQKLMRITASEDLEEKTDSFTNSSFTERPKVMYRAIYGYVQQIEEKLSLISESEKSLHRLYDENEKRAQKVDTTFTDTLNLIEVMKRDVVHKCLRENKEIKQDKSTDSSEECQDQTHNTPNTLQMLKQETEVLEDKIEKEIQLLEKLIREQRDYNRKIIEYIKSDTNMKDKMLQVEGSLFQLSEELKDVLEGSEETFEEIQSVPEKEVTQSSNAATQSSITSVKSVQSGFEFKKTSLKKRETRLKICKSKTQAIKKEIEQIKEMQASLNEKLLLFNRNIAAVEKDSSIESNLDKIIEDHDDLLRNSEKLLKMIAQNESKLAKKQEKLNIMKAAPCGEMVNLQGELKKMAEETSKNIELKTEIEELELRNNSVQHSIDRYEKIIKNLSTQKKKMEIARKENQKKLKMLMANCENVNEIQFTTYVKHCVKLLPRPSFLPIRSKAVSSSDDPDSSDTLTPDQPRTKKSVRNKTSSNDTNGGDTKTTMKKGVKDNKKPKKV